MLKRLGIFVFALAMFVIVVQVVEFLVPLALGIQGPDAEAMSDREALAAFMARQPTAAYLGVAFAHACGALVGGMVLGFGQLTRTYLSVFAALAIAGGVANYYLLPGQPTWFLIVDVLVYYPAALLGYTWVARSRAYVAERAG